jgi:L-alanine-DL-glutamate epimerase-like enolase superfamily enzyme
LVPEPAVAGDGTIAIPEGPGIGIELHPESFAPFLIDHWERHA